MQCEEIRAQFADYVIDQIEEPNRSLVAEHLAVCESCRTETEELRTLWTTLGSVPASEPSPELRSRFHIMLEAYKHGLDHAPRKSWWDGVNSWLSSWWPRQPALQLAVSLGLLILGLMVGRQFYSTSSSSPVPANTEVTELRNELSTMRQMVALTLMQQESASDRIKGVNWSHQLQQPDNEVLTALLSTLMHDSNVNVRLATVDALRQFGDRSVVRRGVVEAIAREQSPMMQIALIDLAVDLREKESINTLRQLTQNEKIDGTVREHAQKGLAELE
jgi:HEAT repeats